MESWILATCLLAGAALTASFVSRRITWVTGRTRSISFMWSMLWAVASVCGALGISALFQLSLPWGLLVAGVLGGAFGLLVQALFGRRTPNALHVPPRSGVGRAQRRFHGR